VNLVFPLLAVIGESGTNIIDKFNLSKNKISPNHLMRLAFVSMSFWVLLFILLTGKSLPHLSLASALLMLLIGAVSFAGNLFDYLSLKANDLSLRQPMLGLEPLLGGFFGYLFFTSERKPEYLIAFVISTLVVLFGTYKNGMAKADAKGILYLSLAVLIYGACPSLYRLGLEHVSPEYLTLFRVAIVALLVCIFLPTKIRKDKRLKSKRFYGLLTGIVCSLGAIAGLYAIQHLGIAQTMLLMLLSPAIMYTAGHLLFGEKVTIREVISSVCLVFIALTTVLN
jgi:drug/metabolite transporter (DMT)-like permease